MNSVSQISKAYSNMQIKTSTNPVNICMLHSKCVLLLKSVINENQLSNHLQIIKVQNIIAELEHALKIEDDLSKSLFYIYDYCYIQLEKHNIKSYQNALSIFSILDNTFKELLKNHQ